MTAETPAELLAKIERWREHLASTAHPQARDMTLYIIEQLEGKLAAHASSGAKQPENATRAEF